MQEQRLYLAKLVANSALGFALGTVVAWQLYQVGLVAGGLLSDREPVWYVDHVEFTAAGSDVAWIGGVLLVLMVGWALASIYRGGSRYDGTRLAVLWVTLHCFRQGLLPLVRVPFDEQVDPSRALATTNLPESFVWVVGVLGVAGLLGIGLLAAPALLRFAPEDLSTKRGRIIFIGLVGVGAWLIGSVLVLPLLVPGNAEAAWELVLWSGVFLTFTLVASPEPREIYAFREAARLSLGPLLLLGILIALARIFLADGLSINF
jgi:hypothetical protein